MVARDWRKVVYDLRKSAEEFLSINNDAALMRCRKTMEAIQYSIFEEINGELPTTFLPFEKMMGNKGIGKHIPKPAVIDFGTVHSWGNYGCHWQSDGEPNDVQVGSALSALDSLIEWRFEEQTPSRNSVIHSKPIESSEEIYIPVPSIEFDKSNKIKKSKESYTVDNFFNYISAIDNKLKYKVKLSKAFSSIIKPNTKSKTYRTDVEKGGGFETIHLLMRAIELSGGEGNNWARLGEVGNRILEIDPDFKVENTGYPRLELLIRHHSAIFESKKTQQGPKKKNVVFVRIRKPTDN